MNMLNGWWFLSSDGSYPLVFTIVTIVPFIIYHQNKLLEEVDPVLNLQD